MVRNTMTHVLLIQRQVIGIKPHSIEYNMGEGGGIKASNGFKIATLYIDTSRNVGSDY